MPRGGRRSGSTGKQYANRSDLNDGRVVLPPSAATGQTYGAAKQQLDAQRQSPMASAPAPAPALAPANTPTPSAGAALAPLPGPAPVMPGEMQPLNAPSQRPNEPITAGLPIGAGPGPEVLTATPNPDPVMRGLSILNSSSAPLPPEIAAVARYVTLGQQQQVTR